MNMAGLQTCALPISVFLSWIRPGVPPILDELHRAGSRRELRHGRYADRLLDTRPAAVLHRPPQPPLLNPATEHTIMIKFATRAQRMTGALLALGGVFVLGACDVNKELLQPQQPGIISPSAVTNNVAADALWAGSLTYWNKAMNGSPTNSGSNQEGLWNWEGLFTDEIRSVDTFSQRNDDDQRNEATNDALLTTIYNTAQQARGRARDAINALNTYDQSTTGKQHVGEMYFMMGYIEMQLSAVFCNGIPFGETANVNGQLVPQ